jgi:hypothetical protein
MVAMVSHIPAVPTILTWTGVQTLREDPFAFFLRFVEKRQPMAAVELERGSGVHEILEQLGRAKYEGREVSPAELLAMTEARAALLVPEAADDLRAIVKRAVERDLMPDFPSDAQDVGFERAFAVSAEGREVPRDSEGALFQSIFDVVYRENGGTLAVVDDYKTSRKIENPGEQMRLYAWAAFAIWPDVEEVLVRLRFVRYGVVKERLYVRGDLDGVAAELQALQDEIYRRQGEGDWTPRISDRCRTCGYRATCPAMRVPRASMPEAKDPRALADRLVQLKVAQEQTEAALRAWAEAYGPVDLGDEVYGPVAREKESVEDAAAAAAILREQGVTPEKLWSEVSLPKAALNKLVTAAIADVPKKERKDARARVEQLLRDEGALVKRTDVEFRRVKKTDETPAEEA